MKIIIKILALLPVLFLTQIQESNAQQCNLQGIVKYEYNDYIGYKIDVGAEIYVISVSNADSVNISDWERYQELAKNYMFYLSIKNDPDTGWVGIETVRSLTEFSEEKEKELEALDSKCFSQFVHVKSNAEYIALVDGSGKYQIELPYGDYYIAAKSNNRMRGLITEIGGRVILEKITINKPATIVGFDFCY